MSLQNNAAWWENFLVWPCQYFPMKVNWNLNNHTVQTGTYLHPTAADVGGLVLVYMSTLLLMAAEDLLSLCVCDSPRHFQDYTNQRDKHGWGMQGVGSTLYMLYVYLRFGLFWGFRPVECRSAYGDGLLCKHRYTNTVGQDAVAGLWRTWKEVFLLSEVKWWFALQEIQPSELAQKVHLIRRRSRKRPDVTRSAVFIYKSPSYAVDITP